MAEARDVFRQFRARHAEKARQPAQRPLIEAQEGARSGAITAGADQRASVVAAAAARPPPAAEQRHAPPGGCWHWWGA
jgi:hypothetical protein